MSKLLTVLGACAILTVSARAQEEPFYLTVDTPPAPELSTIDALSSFSIAPGFKVELIASEPLVEDPVAIAWDEQGDLYVAEMRGFMPDAYGNNQQAPVGVVVRLSDENGDGSFDTREVLLDKLVLPRALAIVNEGLLIGEPPNLWLCPSRSGQAKHIDCSEKRNLGPYGDQPGSVEHAENGLMMGLDNWLYSAKSKRRLQLRDGQLLVEPTLFRGQWGISQDNSGRLFYNTNSDFLLGDAYDAQQVIVAGNRRAPGLGERVSINDQVFAARVNPGVNRAYVPGVLRADGRLNRPTSASGMAVYRGDQFGVDYAEDVFVTEPAANAVVQLRVAHDGLKMTSRHILYADERWGQVEFFTSTDERFRPVDVKVGPDGALYIVDMYRGIIQDHVFLTEELRAQALARQLDKPLGMGRIWRISATTQAQPRPLSDPISNESGALVDLLGHSNGWQRDTAQRLLLARTDRGLDGRLKKAVEEGDVDQAVHALWTLSGRKSLDRRTVLRAIARPETPVELAAARAGHAQLTRSDLLTLNQQISDPVVAQHLTLSLAAHNSHPDTQARLIELLVMDAHDPYRPSAVKAASFRQELPMLEALLEHGAWNASLEQQTGFVQALVVQGFRADPSTAVALLDFVQARKFAERWLQIAVLDGLFDVSRDESFDRIVLAREHSIFGVNDDDLWPAVARARRAFTWSGDDLAVDAKPLSPLQQQRKAAGMEFYRAGCANCHGEDGKGIASLAPPLVDASWVTGSSERLARIILQGLQGPIKVAGISWNGVMPGHGALDELTDATASGLLTYLHRAWGHTGRAIAPEFIAEVRQQTANRTALWTVPELESIDTNTHYRRYVGRYGRPEFSLEFLYNGQDLEIRSAIFNGLMIEEKEDHFLYQPRQLRLEFVLADDGSAAAIRLLNPDGEVELPRLDR
jgi:glucose/arabinose dehydrogenase/mono/diheme cytochrome c family protein